MFHSILKLYKDSFSGLTSDIWWLALVTFINRSGSIVIMFLTIYLTTALDFSLTQAGLAMSCFGAGSVVGSFIGGWLTDKIGFYRTMFWSLFLSGLMFFLIMSFETFSSFCIMVFFLSMVADCFRPASMASISAYSKPENYNRSLSLIRLAINLGFAMGSGVAGFLIALYGYHWLFILDGATCIIAAFSFLLIMTDKPDQEANLIEKSLSNKKGSAYKDYTYLVFVYFVMLMGIVFFQLFSTLPVFLKQEYLFSEKDIGMMDFLNGIIIVVLEMPLVFLLQDRYNRLSLTIIGSAMIGFAFLIFNLTSMWLLATLVCIFAISLGEVISFPFSNAFALSRSSPGRRGQFMGLYSISFSIAFIIAPTLGMYIAEKHGFGTLWYYMAFLSIFACAGFFRVKYMDERSKRLNKDKSLGLHLKP